MSNALTGRLWVCDSVGILTHSNLTIQRVVFFPGAAAQVLQLNSYDSLSHATAANCKTGQTGTITGTTTLTSTGNLPSTIRDGDVFEIYDSSGAAANKSKWLVATAGDGNAVVTAGLTNEASKVYNWRTYPYNIELYLRAGASDASPVTIDFGYRGRRFPNLILETIGGGAAHIYIL
jgi:hypothetical protein